MNYSQEKDLNKLVAARKHQKNSENHFYEVVNESFYFDSSYTYLELLKKWSQNLLEFWKPSPKGSFDIYSYLPNIRGGPNKQGGWKFCQN